MKSLAFFWKASSYVAVHLLLAYVSSQPAPSPHSSPCPVVLPTTRIIGGTLTNTAFMVSLVRPLVGSFCSGTLISPTQVLTAAHCLVIDSIAVFVSSTNGANGKEIPIKSTRTHPTEDIAVLTLSQTVDVRPVQILTNNSLPTPWSFVRAQGFGTQSFFPFPIDSRLRFVDLPVISGELCEDLIGDRTDIDGRPFSEDSLLRRRLLCTGYLESTSCGFCSGDSGGPVLTFRNKKPVLIAVISRSVLCAAPDLPGVSVRIANNIQWLDQIGVQYKGVNQLSETFVDNRSPTQSPAFVPIPDIAPTNAAEGPIIKVNTVQVGLSGGAIAGIVLGSLALALAAVLVAVFVMKAVRKGKSADTGEDDEEGGEETSESETRDVPSKQSNPQPDTVQAPRLSQPVAERPPASKSI